MKLRHLIAVIAVSLCCMSVGAEPAIGPKDGKVAAAITLRNVSPTSIMQGWKLFTLKDMMSGNTSVWRREKSELLPGIDLVVPCDGERVLLVYGEANAIETLKAAVATADVTPKQVQVKIEIVRIGLDAQKKFGVANGIGDEAGKRLADGIRQAIKDGGAELMNAPIISTIDNGLCEVSISSDSEPTKLWVLPRINPDGSVTLAIDVSVAEKGADRKHELFTQRRLADGETVVLGGFHSGPGKDGMLVVLMSATIVP